MDCYSKIQNISHRLCTSCLVCIVKLSNLSFFKVYVVGFSEDVFNGLQLLNCSIMIFFCNKKVFWYLSFFFKGVQKLENRQVNCRQMGLIFLMFWIQTKIKYFWCGWVVKLNIDLTWWTNRILLLINIRNNYCILRLLKKYHQLSLGSQNHLFLNC